MLCCSVRRHSFSNLKCAVGVVPRRLMIVRMPFAFSLCMRRGEGLTGSPYPFLKT